MEKTPDLLKQLNENEVYTTGQVMHRLGLETALFVQFLNMWECPRCGQMHHQDAKNHQESMHVNCSKCRWHGPCL